MSNTMRMYFAAALMLLPAVSRGQSAAAAGTITVRAAGRAVKLSAVELGKLPRKTIMAAGEGSDSAAVSGVTLWDVLQRAGVVPAEASGAAAINHWTPSKDRGA